ncbi:MAG TPA: DUF5671 domain-containing protein [Magnetospirillum sp.]|nr:DUF5671 domain-containing protein [Magnetospirillum sp.]
MSAELSVFVRDSLAAGLERPRIMEALRSAGWSEPDIEAALANFADVSFPFPVPRPKPYLSTREVFLYLLMFSALYACAWNLGSLLFHFIERAFPDPAEGSYRRNFGDAVRMNISALVVFLPLFVTTFRITAKEIDADPTKSRSRPRKWLTYLTLFVASCAVAGDLVALVYNVLGGEYGIRFLLKVATVAVIAGGIFTYFLSEMRRDEK